LDVLGALTYVLVFVLGIGLAMVIVLFVIDVTQKHDEVRRNYPGIGRFRHIFASLGEFFRKYFFAMDREEMPCQSRRTGMGRAGWQGQGQYDRLWFH